MVLKHRVLKLYQCHGVDCIECWAEINKQYYDIGDVIVKVTWTDRRAVEMASSVDILVLIANWDFIFDVLENDLLKAVHQVGGDFHRW